MLQMVPQLHLSAEIESFTFLPVPNQVKSGPQGVLRTMICEPKSQKFTIFRYLPELKIPWNLPRNSRSKMTKIRSYFDVAEICAPNSVWPLRCTRSKLITKNCEFLWSGFTNHGPEGSLRTGFVRIWDWKKCKRLYLSAQMELWDHLQHKHFGKTFQTNILTL